jgi:hypothetical protein
MFLHCDHTVVVFLDGTIWDIDVPHLPEGYQLHGATLGRSLSLKR